MDLSGSTVSPDSSATPPLASSSCTSITAMILSSSRRPRRINSRGFDPLLLLSSALLPLLFCGEGKSNMPLALLALQTVILLAVVVLILRRPASAADPRLASLPDQITRLDTRSEAVERRIDTGLRRCATNSQPSQTPPAKPTHQPPPASAPKSSKPLPASVLPSTPASTASAPITKLPSRPYAQPSTTPSASSTSASPPSPPSPPAPRSKPATRSTLASPRSARTMPRTRRSCAPVSKPALASSTQTIRRSSKRCAPPWTRSCTPRCTPG